MEEDENYNEENEVKNENEVENENKVEEKNETEEQENLESTEIEAVTPEPIDIKKEQDDLLEYCFKAAVKLHLQER